MQYFKPGKSSHSYLKWNYSAFPYFLSHAYTVIVNPTEASNNNVKVLLVKLQGLFVFYFWLCVMSERVDIPNAISSLKPAVQTLRLQIQCQKKAGFKGEEP